MLTFTVDGGDISASRPGHFTPEQMSPLTIAENGGCNPEPVQKLWRRDEALPCRPSGLSHDSDYAVRAVSLDVGSCIRKAVLAKLSVLEHTGPRISFVRNENKAFCLVP